jgi:hypothetical protein
MQTPKLTVGRFTVTARLDDLGSLRISIDAGDDMSALFQVCNLSDRWQGGDSSEIILSTDRRIAVAEGIDSDDEEAWSSLHRTIVEDLGFREAFAALGEEARRRVASELQEAAKQVTIGIPAKKT